MAVTVDYYDHVGHHRHLSNGVEWCSCEYVCGGNRGVELGGDMDTRCSLCGTHGATLTEIIEPLSP